MQGIGVCSVGPQTETKFYYQLTILIVHRESKLENFAKHADYVEVMRRCLTQVFKQIGAKFFSLYRKTESNALNLDRNERF